MKQLLLNGESFLARMQGHKVLVLGDLMIDQYIWGSVDRVSPEAPVPVVGVKKETLRPGGAANVAGNVVSLGGRAEVCGILGNDQMGRWLAKDLKKRGIGTRGVVMSADRPTTIKTRVLAHNQQMLRFDREVTDPIRREEEEELLEMAAAILPECRAILISDYAKGVVTPNLIRRLVALAHKARIPVCVDPKVKHFSYYQQVTVLTPNLLEASAGAGIIIRTLDDLAKAGRAILKKLDCESLLITRGDQGMTLFTRGGAPQHIPALAREVFDVTGAGDTVVATLALGLAGGLAMVDAAKMANVAAGIVVGEVGTVPVTRAQLRERFAELRAMGK